MRCEVTQWGKRVLVWAPVNMTGPYELTENGQPATAPAGNDTVICVRLGGAAARKIAAKIERQP